MTYIKASNLSYQKASYTSYNKSQFNYLAMLQATCPTKKQVYMSTIKQTHLSYHEASPPLGIAYGQCDDCEEEANYRQNIDQGFSHCLRDWRSLQIGTVRGR